MSSESHSSHHDIHFGRYTCEVRTHFCHDVSMHTQLLCDRRVVKSDTKDWKGSTPFSNEVPVLGCMKPCSLLSKTEIVFCLPCRKRLPDLWKNLQLQFHASRFTDATSVALILTGFMLHNWHKWILFRCVATKAWYQNWIRVNEPKLCLVSYPQLNGVVASKPCRARNQQIIAPRSSRWFENPECFATEMQDWANSSVIPFFWQ